jgi:hypothetical protein
MLSFCLRLCSSTKLNSKKIKNSQIRFMGSLIMLSLCLWDLFAKKGNTSWRFYNQPLKKSVWLMISFAFFNQFRLARSDHIKQLLLYIELNCNPERIEILKIFNIPCNYNFNDFDLSLILYFGFELPTGISVKIMYPFNQCRPLNPICTLLGNFIRNFFCLINSLFVLFCDLFR